MSYLLSDPTTVLAIGVSTETLDEFRPALRAGEAEDIERVAGVRDARRRIVDDDVGVLLIGDETGIDPVEVCGELAEEAPRRPFVAVPTSGSEQLAYRFLRAGGDGYVPRSEGIEAVRDAVDDALGQYVERRDEHAESSMFDTLLTDSSIPLYAKDREARYVRKSVVPAGQNPEAMIGKTDPEVYDSYPRTVTEWYQDDLAVVRSEEAIYEKEECLETAEGEYWSRTTKVPWYEDDTLRGLIGISFDITDYVELRYRLEEYEERFEKFADSVTHDLQNPLQVASGNLELARENRDEESLERAAAALDRIDEMLGDLSTVATEEQRTASRSRVADHSFETVSLTPLRLVDLVEDVWSVLDTDEATLDCEMSDDTRIYAPEAAVRPVLENLLKNAVRHAGPGATVRIGHHPDGGFYIEDDGPGIPPEDRDQIFEDGYSTASDGSGTGLAIVSEIAAGQGWTIEVTDGALGGARIGIHNCLLVRSPRLADPVGSPVELTGETAVGDFDVEGSATYDEETGEWTVVGGGMNVWQSTNEFYFVHAAVEGPATIQGRVLDLEAVGQYSKAGLMVRDSLEEDATYGHIGIIPDARTEVLWRTRRGEDGVSQFVDRDLEKTPWFRVDRVGDTVTVAVSDDGEEWTPVNERRVELGATVYLGLVVCSFRPRTTCEALFDDVRVRRLAAEES